MTIMYHNPPLIDLTYIILDLCSDPIHAKSKLVFSSTVAVSIQVRLFVCFHSPTFSILDFCFAFIFGSTGYSCSLSDISCYKSDSAETQIKTPAMSQSRVVDILHTNSDIP